MAQLPVSFEDAETKLTWKFNCQLTGLLSNCGAGIIACVHLSASDSAKKTQWYASGTPVKWKLETAFGVMDRYKKDILANFPLGFYILSDTIAYGKDFFDTKTRDQWMCTSRFAAWLVSRKIGAIFRGPITNNPNYTVAKDNPDGSGHMICPWIWVPDVKNVKNADCEWYINDEWKGFTDKGEFGKKRLPRAARSYVNRERGLANGTLGLNGKKVTPVTEIA